MSTSTAYWFAPSPSELTSTRLSLDFGVRSADLAFRELVVPGLGRVWFVRQLSWPVAALALHAELRRKGKNAPRPSAICHGIEALACKLQFRADPDSDRVLGKRAFGRDELDEVWDFARLHRRAYYVQNTHRQASTRTLRTDLGLGLAEGPRFDLLALESVGTALAQTFLGQRVGQGGGSLERWLLGWVMGEAALPRSPRSLTEALTPAKPSREERQLVRARVLETVGPAAEKRRRLADALGRAAERPDIERETVPRLRAAGHVEQADQILAALAFGALLDRSREALGHMTLVVEGARRGVAAGVLAGEPAVRRALRALQTAAKSSAATAETACVSFPASRALVDEILRADDAGLVRVLVARSSGLLAHAEATVARGPLFRVLAEGQPLTEDEAAEAEPDGTGRTFRIANLHALVRDFGTRGES
jgi:hypothetical protein